MNIEFCEMTEEYQNKCTDDVKEAANKLLEFVMDMIKDLDGNDYKQKLISSIGIALFHNYISTDFQKQFEKSLEYYAAVLSQVDKSIKDCH